MTWVESRLGGFRARHDESDARDARRVLESLSLVAARMEGLFARPVDEITVVLHGSVASLTMTNPVMPLTWLMTDPAARRYVAGWAGATELHVLSPALLRARASNVDGLARDARAERGVALRAARDHRQQPRSAGRDARDPGPAGAALGVAARGRRALVLRPDRARAAGDRAAPARGRLSRAFRRGCATRPLLGGTVIDLLAREEGEPAAAAFATAA